jgi:hypothetical protein
LLASANTGRTGHAPAVPAMTGIPSAITSKPAFQVADGLSRTSKIIFDASNLSADVSKGIFEA